MARFTCSVCALSPVHLAAVENELNNGVKFRDVAQASGLSKSALHRHWVNCRAKRRLAELKARKMGAAEEGRCVIVWPEGYGELACSVATPRGGSVAFDIRTLAPNDFVIKVEFEAEVPERPATEDADAAVEPDAEETENPPETLQFSEPPESNIVADEVCSPEPTPCEHVWRDVAVSVTRCEKCGAQKPVHAVGVSRDYVQRKRGASFLDKRLFGRFG